MFQARVDVIGVTTTPDGTVYVVTVNGHPFSFRDDDELRIGVKIEGGEMVPVRMPVLDPKNPSLLTAFALDGEQAHRMVDEGLSLRYVTHPVARPVVSEN